MDQSVEPKQDDSMASEDKIKEMIIRNKKRTYELYSKDVEHDEDAIQEIDERRIAIKIQRQYSNIGEVPGILVPENQRKQALKHMGVEMEKKNSKSMNIMSRQDEEEKSEGKARGMLAIEDKKSKGKEDAQKSRNKDTTALSLVSAINQNQNQIALRHKKEVEVQWHAPWKLKRVISGHTGWVRCIAVDPMNKFFATGSNDRTIKFWDLADGKLKITLTGHINTVRGIAISDRHPYLFSCGEDKTVKCWDLEQNKVVRHYHGHLSGVYCLALHPELDLLVTGGRDSTARVWDMRTKAQVHVLGGHANTVEDIICQADEPQIITGSHDKMIRMWDIRTGSTIKALTQHKKGVRALVNHHQEHTFASAGSDKIRIWKQPEGDQLRTISDHNAVVNSLAINEDNVLVSGGDDGSLQFYDWTSGQCFQKLQSPVQPGSLSSEAAIFDIKFDRSSMRMITAECDKSIKIWKEDEDATPETHPVVREYV